MSYSFHILTKKEEMLPLWPVIQELNPAVTEVYLDSVLDAMIEGGYRIVTIQEGDRCLGLSGIWVGTKIYSGKYLEMDNVVVTAAYRAQGLGQLLTDYILVLAQREGCITIMLDAYLENEKGHAFYERNGFVRRGYHFIKKL